MPPALDRGTDTAPGTGRAAHNDMPGTVVRVSDIGTFDRSTLLQIVQASYALNGALYAAGSALSGWAGG
jgi:hypothetical protein